MNAVAEQSKRDLILNPQNRALAEQWRQDWVVNAEPGTTIEDVLKPSYWSHFAAELQRFDRVEIRLETGEWTADVIIKEVGRNWAAVHLIKQHMLQENGPLPEIAPEFEIIYRGPQHKHAVKRVSDGAIIQENLPTKAEAAAWLANHERVTRN